LIFHQFSLFAKTFFSTKFIILSKPNLPVNCLGSIEEPPLCIFVFPLSLRTQIFDFGGSCFCPFGHLKRFELLFYLFPEINVKYPQQHKKV
jgi:hypothetical protein